MFVHRACSACTIPSCRACQLLSREGSNLHAAIRYLTN
jgi:hypothetical protein